QRQGEESLARMLRDHTLDLFQADLAQLRLQIQVAQRPAIRRERAIEQADHRQREQQQRERPCQQSEDEGPAHGRSPPRLVSRMRQHSESKSSPVALAAFGTSEWLVMPGAVFTSSSQLRPWRSRITSTRPQPVTPMARKAASESARISSSSRPSRPGHTYCVSSATYFA